MMVALAEFVGFRIIAAGAITRTWHIAYLDPNGVRDEIAIQLHEPSYVGNDIGFKTWGAAPLLAK